MRRVERHALQAFAGGAPDRLRVLRRRVERAVARDRREVVEAELQPIVRADVALALQVARRRARTATVKMRDSSARSRATRQVALERRLAADRSRLAVGDDRTVVAAVRRVDHPARRSRAPNMALELAPVGRARARRSSRCRARSSRAARLRADAVDPRAGSGQIRVGTSASRSTVSPSGLSRSDAIFASSLFGATAIEQVSPVASRTASLSARRDVARPPPSVRIVLRLALVLRRASRRRGRRRSRRSRGPRSSARSRAPPP